MKKILLLLAFFASTVAFSAEPVDWRALWDGDKSDWWDKPTEELRRLAAEKNPYAIMALANKLYGEDESESKKLRLQAIDLGFPQAMLWLAEDSETPEAQATALTARAAEMGFPRAELRLAVIAFDGGFRPDYDKALRLLRKAADGGYSDAMVDLAQVYATGIGEPRNDADKPIALLRAAARIGNLDAAQELEKRFRLGTGTEIDLLVSAYYYYRVRLVRPEQNGGFNRKFELSRNPNKDAIELLQTLFENAFTRRDNAALLELAKLHQTGTHGKPNLPRACAILTVANSPEAAAKAKLLNPEDQKAMDRDLQWMKVQSHR